MGDRSHKKPCFCCQPPVGTCPDLLTHFGRSAGVRETGFLFYFRLCGKGLGIFPVSGVGAIAGVRETGFLFYFRLCGKGFEKKPGFWVLGFGCDRGIKKPGFYFTFGYVAKVWEYSRFLGAGFWVRSPGVRETGFIFYNTFAKITSL